VYAGSCVDYCSFFLEDPKWVVKILYVVKGGDVEQVAQTSK